MSGQERFIKTVVGQILPLEQILSFSPPMLYDVTDDDGNVRETIYVIWAQTRTPVADIEAQDGDVLNAETTKVVLGEYASTRECEGVLHALEEWLSREDRLSQLFVFPESEEEDEGETRGEPQERTAPHRLIEREE